MKRRKSSWEIHCEGVVRAAKYLKRRGGKVQLLRCRNSRAARNAGLGLPPLSPGGYPKGRARSAACRKLHQAFKRSGYGQEGYGLHDRATAMGCPWAFRERLRRVG